ncbi:MAG: hypothetical protein CVU46_11820 [Chloroflexi bacterium HGW-Chloroflexi-8]|nr:MAG: hypothetical protein CVU46_11820 [Chloroflexi bacterium HGW-Chloroflexi-8]
MKTGRHFLLVFSIILFFIFTSVACQFDLLSKDKIKVITQEAPITNPVDKTPFQNVGCSWQSDNFAVCEDEGVLKKMGCDSITSASDFLSLLSPALPLVVCNYTPYLQDPVDETAEGIYNQGCRMPMLVRLIVYQDGNYQLIQNTSGLRSFYAPIENSNEALAYAIAATGKQPLYKYDSSLDYRYLIKELPETKVEEISGGYEVLLYDYQFCGCGPHTHSIVKVNVQVDGTLTLSDPIPAYEDPEQDGLCID